MHFIKFIKCSNCYAICKQALATRILEITWLISSPNSSLSDSFKKSEICEESSLESLSDKCEHPPINVIRWKAFVAARLQQENDCLCNRI